MKKFLAITTTFLAAAGCALGFGGAAAFADTEDTADGREYYPDTFVSEPSFTKLDDYAVGNGKFLFLQDGCIYEYGNERVITYDNGNKTINHLYFEGGEFYYETVYGVYALKNFNAEENHEVEDFTSTTEINNITIGNYHYYVSGEVLKILNTATDGISTPEGFSKPKLKRYGDSVYAVRTTEENKQVLCSFEDGTPVAVTVENFELTEDIKVGGAFTKLSSSVEDEPKFVSLKSGAYMTNVNLDVLDKNSLTFTTGDEGTIKVPADTTALLLYSYKDEGSGEGLAIVSVKKEAYLIHPKNVAEKPVDPFTKSEYDSGTITVDCPVYSTPYESGGTRVVELAPKTPVTIISEIRKANREELNSDFYYIKYVDGDGNDAYGYVRFGLLSPYDFKEDPPTPTEDPNATYEDLIKPVVLILLVLLLIAIAAGYLIYIGTSDKRKKKNEAAATDANERNKQ